MATLIQNDSSPTFFEGWYGTCPEANANACDSFPLISGSGKNSEKIHDQIQAVYVISANGQGTLAYDGSQTIPFLISLIPVKTLECGKSYRIILKPGTGSLEIPEFTFANAGTSDSYRLTDDCNDEPTPTPMSLVPANFDATSATNDSLGLRWELTSVIENKVLVELATDEDFSNVIAFTIVEETDEKSTVLFTGLSEGTQYFARIKSHTEQSGYGEYTTLSASTTIDGQNLNAVASYTDSDKPKLEWTEIDFEYQYVGVYRNIDSSYAKIMTINKSDASEFIDNSVNEDGTYQYKLNIFNGFSGKFSDPYSVEIDTTPPGQPSPTTQTPTNNKKPTWTWNSVEQDVDYEIKIDNTIVDTIKNASYTSSVDLSDGTHTIEVVAIDSFGNRGSVGTHQVVIDSTPPNVPDVEYEESPTNNKKPTWTWEQDVDVHKFGVVFNDEQEIETTDTSFTPPTELSDGTYTLKVRAKDELENWSDYDQATIQIDATPPSVPQFTSATGLTKINKPTWTWDSVADAVIYGVVLNSNTEIQQSETTFTSPIDLQDGTHTLKVRAKDAVNNWSDYSESEIIVDTTAPAVPKPESLTPTKSTKPTWTWVATSDVELYELKINDEEVQTTTDNQFTPSSNLSSGSYTLSVRAKDEVGNTSDWGTHEVIVDIDPPNVPNPTSVSPTSNKLPSWTWDSDEDVVEYGVTLNSSPEIFQTENTFTAPVALSDGDNEIFVRAKDEVGNWSDVSSNVVVIDTLAPSVPNVFSDTPVVNIKRPTWKWDAITQASIFNWKLKKINSDGSLISNVATGETTLNVFIPSQDLTDGIYELEVTSLDTLNNESVPGSHIITVDATPPNLPEINVDTPTRTRKPTFTYSSDSEDVSAYGVVFDSGPEDVTSSTTFIPSGDLANGTYELKVRAKDEVGNWSEYKSQDVEIFSIPSSHDTITIPQLQGPPRHNALLGSMNITFLAEAAVSADIWGFDQTKFVGTQTIAVDIFVENTPAGLVWIANETPAVGDCVYLERNGITYWSKLRQDSNGGYRLEFISNFTHECE